jgi:hypothetical protein
MCACDDQLLTFESMITDPMFRMLLTADGVSLDEVTALYVRAGSAIAAQRRAAPDRGRPRQPSQAS